MANGRLGPRGEGALDALAERHGATVDAVAIAVALAQPWADLVLSGAVTPDQLRSNAGALDLVLSVEEIAELPAEPPEVYWERRSSLAWS
jgi:aryl-alcohol dehydrogenase-like predicted oxidoreductase